MTRTENDTATMRTAKKLGWRGLNLRKGRKGDCPWCLEQMVCLCLCAFWWHPLGIGEVFKHSFRGLRQIRELRSLSPSGPSAGKCVHVCVHYTNCHWEEHACVSIAIVSNCGERSSLDLTLRPRCSFLIVASDAGFGIGFFLFIFFFWAPVTINNFN